MVIGMKAVIRKTGNSHYILISKEDMTTLKLSHNDIVEVSLMKVGHLSSTRKLKKRKR